MVRKPILEIREGIGNGKGPARLYHIVPKEDLAWTDVCQG